MHLFWLLYWPGSTHRPHKYPTPGRAWGMGVVGGRTRAVPARPPSPLTPLLHNLAVVLARQHPQTTPLCVHLPSAKTVFIVAPQSYFEKTTTQASYFSILSSIILWYLAIQRNYMHFSRLFRPWHPLEEITSAGAIDKLYPDCQCISSLHKN